MTKTTLKTINAVNKWFNKGLLEGDDAIVLREYIEDEVDFKEENIIVELINVEKYLYNMTIEEFDNYYDELEYNSNFIFNAVNEPIIIVGTIENKKAVA